MQSVNRGLSLRLRSNQRELADAIHVPYQWINEIVNRRRGVTPSTALRLAKYLGMSASFWLNLQLRRDLYHAQRIEEGELETIHPYKLPVPAQAWFFVR